MVMECSYAVTAWTQAVEDEHRLLSQVLAIFYAYPEIPRTRSTAASPTARRRARSRRRIGQGKGEKSDFWSAVGGQYKVSLDYVVRLSVESGAPSSSAARRSARRPSARALTDGPPRTVLEMHRSVGRVSDKKGEPLARRLGHAPGRRHLASSNADGRVPLRPPAARPAPAARAHRRRPRGRRAA